MSIASRDTILAALRYLISEPGSALKGVDPIIATNKIVAADRNKWSDLNSIISLKCGITKGKKFDAIKKVFSLPLPVQIPQPPPLPEMISIQRASRDEIFARLSYLSKYKIDEFEVDAEQASDIIFSESKGKWKSLNPISKLECGIDTAKIKTLKKVFSL
ncbi:hypothetical protein [Cylindrospermum sp. FACHB-282]|uniref:hypothetical protein n=1 Tax=Cylindrospermum sp. FACHB-282 TaxID=2692794 RepID=UPI001686CAE1|nr:hypothetical protein [Cylindrospermum sp. FACHB-282]MBD2385017.1 hypothetical protein [Cylindrospermum sp. FACHB-282]